MRGGRRGRWAASGSDRGGGRHGRRVCIGIFGVFNEGYLVLARSSQ